MLTNERLVLRPSFRVCRHREGKVLNTVFPVDGSLSTVKPVYEFESRLVDEGSADFMSIASCE